MKISQYRELYGDDSDAAPGWDAIDSRLNAVYGSQEPRQLASLKAASRSSEQIIEEQRRLNPMLVTDLARRDS